MKEICFLHHRDPPGTPRLSLIEELTDRSGMITWTFVQTMLRDRSNKWMLDSPQAAGRVTPEQLEFADAAYHYLSERQQQGPRGLSVAVYPSIYDVVWNYRRLEGQGSIFRGQWNAWWPSDSSLLRPAAGGLPLSLNALVGRLKQTEAFLAELRNRQRQLFGAEIDDESLLAIAQHYGFPTPLLDYTRSLDVAAFFATQPAARLARGSEMIGVIYYMRPDRSELAAPGELQNIGLPGFSLLQSAGIRIGDVSIIEPRIPDEDNRIARQKGLFISGYRTRDLQGIAIDRLYFRQLPGEVFEDPSADVTADHLLPDSSPVALLAQEVKDRIPPQTEPRLDEGLAGVLLPGGGIIGSQGAMLFAQVREAGGFFESLADAVNNAHDITDPDTVLSTLGQIFADYFQNAHAVSAVDEVPITQASLSSLDPIQIALDELAELCGMDRDVLDQVVETPLEMPWTREQRGDPNAEIDESNSGAGVPPITLERVAMACALYLTSWAYLIQVNGEAARTIVQNARYILLEESG
jgi:FRG domain